MNKEKIKYNVIQIKEEVENLKKQNISMNGKNYFIVMKRLLTNALLTNIDKKEKLSE